MTTYFSKSQNEESVTILNQPGSTYSMDLWERLKNAYGLTDQQLANNLNNE